MSWIDLIKRAAPGNPAADHVVIGYATAGPGSGTPIALTATDQAGNVASLAHFVVPDYRLIAVRFITASPYVPSVGCRIMLVECQAGGGAGGGVATAATNSGAGGGGGGGAYSASWLAPSSASITCSVGAGGTGVSANTGNAGADTTWDTTVIVAKGGAGGLIDTITTIHIGGAGGAGGLAASGTGTMKSGGSAGGWGYAAAAATAISGQGGSSAFGGGGATVKSATSVGTVGQAYGGGGSGACAISGGASQTGGAGGIGFIRVWEFG